MRIPRSIEREIEEASMNTGTSNQHVAEIHKWMSKSGISNQATLAMLESCLQEGPSVADDFKEFIEIHTKDELQKEDALF